MKDCCSNPSAEETEGLENEDLEVFICYCFKKTKLDLVNAIEKQSLETFMSEIKAKMENPGCFCESANPSGKCCLGDIAAFSKFIKSST
jgi:hypothetical protein